jgi:hypothetical protein
MLLAGFSGAPSALVSVRSGGRLPGDLSGRVFGQL